MVIGAKVGGDIGAGFGGAIGGIINAIDPGRGGKRFFNQQLGIWQDIPDPEYDPRDILMEQLLQTGELTPEIYEAIAEPQARLIQEDPTTREAQLRALLGMEQIGREGLPLQDRLMAEEAQRRVGSEFERSNAAIMQNMARRGRAGGGTELAARLAAAGNAAELARGQGSDLAQMSVQNRIMGMREAAGMSGAMRGQDVQTSALNAEMQNRYNQWLGSLRTGAARDAAGARQGAQLYNVGERQRLSDLNITNRYASRTAAQYRKDDLQDRLFGARAKKAEGMSLAYQNLADAADAEQQAKQARVKGITSGIGGGIGGIVGGRF